MRQKRKVKPGRYIFPATGLILLIVMAFLAPKLIFAVQDTRTCSEVKSGAWELMDVTSFDSAYETDLYSRLFRFASELADGKQFYVTAQSGIDQEAVRQLLLPGEALYFNGLWLLIDCGLLPVEMQTYEILDAKQYVIYGENFAEGVNFIAWYIELGMGQIDGEKPVVKMLVDAKTGEIYAMAADSRILPWYDLKNSKNGNAEPSLQKRLGMLDEDMQELAVNFAYWFGGAENAGYINVYGQYQDQISVDYTEGYYTILDTDEQNTELPEEAAENLQELMTEATWRIGDDGNDIGFGFPYGSCSLDFEMRLTNREGAEGTALIGFPEIYNRIPGFTE